MSAVFAVVYWLAGLTIGLGALGHGIGGTRALEAALRAGTLDPRWNEIIHIVWHFTTATMVAISLVVLSGWFVARRIGPRGFIGPAIGATLYLGFGLAAFAYQHGETFWLLFAAQGIAVLVSIAGIARRLPSTAAPPRLT